MLAAALGCNFVEADDYHSQANKGMQISTRIFSVFCGFAILSNLPLLNFSALLCKTMAAKMSKGIPLTDTDRTPWLESLRDAIRELLDRGEDVAVSCSALQLKYREILRDGDINYKAGCYGTCRVKFVCLEASAELIADRVRRRAKEAGHFMPASLVQSQLDLLKIDENEGITVVDATLRPETIVKATIAQYKAELASTASLMA
jgi:gluconokinase